MPARAAAVQDGRRPPRLGAARSVLDSREHDGILAASGPPMPPKPQLAAVYPRFLTAANKQ